MIGFNMVVMIMMVGIMMMLRQKEKYTQYTQYTQYTGCSFNQPAPFSVLKRQTTCSQPEALFVLEKGLVPCTQLVKVRVGNLV